MRYPRVLTVQDISCLGQCSMTIALPVLSAMGMETCILPTALLSTHTGGFGPPVIRQLHEGMEETWQHWQTNGISFDAILVGYLGSVPAVESVKKWARTMLSPGGLLIVDPVMGDHGRLYSGFDGAYVEAMKSLASQADILLPNVTEASLFTGSPWRESLTEEYTRQLINGLEAPCVVLTGVGYREGETGVLLRQGKALIHISQEKVGGSCHGTGDLFASVFTGALMQGRSLSASAELAAEFTARVIAQTKENPAHWYGLKFEPMLGELSGM